MSATAPAAPPSPAEVQRKLSVHAHSPPSHRRRTSLSKSPSLPSALSGAESDIDIAALGPPAIHGAFDASSSQQQALQPHPSLLPNAGQPAQLAVITERPGGSGEDSDDDDDDDWNPTDGRSLEELENLTDENMAKAGYLFKKGERRKTWKKRWFVLRQTQLSYYKSDKEYKLLRLLPMSEIHCVTPVTLKRHINTFGIITPSRTFYVQAESAADADSWVRALNEAKGRLTTGGVAPDGRKILPPSINVQRSTPVNIRGPEPRTPPPQGLSASPSSPNNHQQHLTSSDSEDPDSYASSSPVVTSGPLGSNTAPSQTTAERDPNKAILQGYLMKCGAKRKNWRKRWFVLTADRLVYVKSHMDVTAGRPNKKDKYVPVAAMLDAIECTVPKGGLGLGLGVGERAGSVAVGTSMSMPGTLGSSTNPSAAMAHSATAHLPSSQQSSTMAPSSAINDIHAGLPHTFKIVTAKRAMLLCAPSEEEEIKWLSAVRALIARRTGNPVGTAAESTFPYGQGTSSSSQKRSGQNVPSASPNKRASRREMNGSSSSSPPRGDFVSSSAPQNIGSRRKDSVSLDGVAATAMGIPAGSA